jgi:arylsulfatase A-like enzyme
MRDAGSKPFYLNLWYYNVHTPLEAKASDEAYFKGKLSQGFHHRNETYAAMVKAVDDNVGRLFMQLDDLGIAENTIVIFISDNGGYINEYKNKAVTSNFPLRSGKGSLYEGGIRIPTIIYQPHARANGQKIKTPVSTIDFYPTLLEMTGAKSNLIVDGKSILPLLKGEVDTALNNRTLYWHYPHYYPTTTPVCTLREGNWKLLEYLEDGHIELYNLAADIGESHNQAREEPIRTDMLLRKLHNWKVSIDAQGITPNPKFKL